MKSRILAFVELLFLAAAPAGKASKTDGMALVPAGEFLMGCNEKEDPGCDADERPQHKVSLGDFYIDKMEVTAGQYVKCVKAGACGKPDPGVFCTYQDAGKKDHPANCVSWERAAAYCKWAGKRLPTEAEWEKAARGTDGRLFPWGAAAPNCERAVMNEGTEDGCDRMSPWAVGSKPAGASPYGALDMAGNVWEWVSDWYDKKYYSKSPASGPKGPESGKYRVLKGWGWSNNAGQVRSSGRLAIEPSIAGSVYGFRCAMDKK